MEVETVSTLSEPEVLVAVIGVVEVAVVSVLLAVVLGVLVAVVLVAVVVEITGREIGTGTRMETGLFKMALMRV